MAKSCSVCEHPDREAIDKALREGVTPYKLAQRYGLPKESLRRHRTNHVGMPTVKEGLISWGPRRTRAISAWWDGQGGNVKGMAARIQNLTADVDPVQRLAGAVIASARAAADREFFGLGEDAELAADGQFWIALAELDPERVASLVKGLGG